ncbi:MAG: hypothetical protein ABI598_05015 [Chloroflexota bacterium]
MDPLDGPAPLDPTGQQPGSLDPVRPDLAALPSFLREAEGPNDSGSSAGGRERGTLERSDVRRLASAIETSGISDLAAPDPSTLPLATISPRRLLQAVAVVALAWGLISFGRQVASATAASSHADELRAANTSLQIEVAALQREFILIQEPRYVALAARAYRLGTAREIPFALGAGVPALADDAPGSAAVRVGAGGGGNGPLESWLHLLFGSR